MADESKTGARTRYCVEAGVLVVKLVLDHPFMEARLYGATVEG